MPAAFPGMRLKELKFKLFIRPEIPDEVLEQVCDEVDWETLEDALRSLIADFIDDTPLLKDNGVRVEME